jgi:hypothetical protein
MQTRPRKMELTNASTVARLVSFDQIMCGSAAGIVGMELSLHVLLIVSDRLPEVDLFEG